MIFPRGSRKANVSSKKDWDFTGKDYQKLECLYITKIGQGEISSK